MPRVEQCGTVHVANPVSLSHPNKQLHPMKKGTVAVPGDKLFRWVVSQVAFVPETNSARINSSLPLNGYTRSRVLVNHVSWMAKCVAMKTRFRKEIQFNPGPEKN